MAELVILKKTLGGKGLLCSDALQFAAGHAAAQAFHFLVNCVQDDTTFNIGNFFQDWASEKAQSEGLTGHHQMPAKEQRSGGMRSGAHGGLMCPLEKGVRGIEIGHQMPGWSWRAGKAEWRWKARRP